MTTQTFRANDLEVTITAFLSGGAAVGLFSVAPNGEADLDLGDHGVTSFASVADAAARFGQLAAEIVASPGRYADAYARRIRERAEDQAAIAGVPVPGGTGSILVRTWGCEQTNATFYRVARRTATTVILVELATVATWEGDTMTGTAVPGDDLGTPAIRRRIDRDGVVKVDGYSKARPWNRKPVHVTCYG